MNQGHKGRTVPQEREDITRRQMMAGVGTAAVVGAVDATAKEQSERSPMPGPASWPISLNTSTLRGHKLPIAEIIRIAAEAGYQGIEPWVDELDRHVTEGGSLRDVGKRIADAGLKVTGAIAFFVWMVDDDAERRRGFEEARRRMGQLAEIGATHIAAPPAGHVAGVDLLRVAKRYHELLELGAKEGIIPAVEIWGGAGNCSRLGEAVLIAIEADHPKACILPDVFHLYRGGSPLSAVRLLNAKLLAGFHVNDYPAAPPREEIADRNRVYPGDGVAPLAVLFRDLLEIGYSGPLSIELFNPDYYKQDPVHVARTALAKTRKALQSLRLD